MSKPKGLSVEDKAITQAKISSLRYHLKEAVEALDDVIPVANDLLGLQYPLKISRGQRWKQEAVKKAEKILSTLRSVVSDETKSNKEEV